MGELKEELRQIVRLRRKTGASAIKCKRMLNAAKKIGIPEDVFVKDGYWRVPEDLLPIAWENRFKREKEVKRIKRISKENTNGLIEKMIEAQCTARLTPSNFRKYMWHNIPQEERDLILLPVHNVRISERYDNPDFDPEYLNNKAKFYEYFSDMIGRKWFEFKADSSEEAFLDAVEDMTAAELILKPLNARSGAGVQKVPTPHTREEAKSLFDDLMNQVDAKEDEANEILVEEAIVQNEVMSLLNSSSVNSIRIVVLLNDDKEDVLYAACRMGKPGAPADNLGRGGRTVAVDAANGRIITPAYGSSNEPFFETAESGVELMDITLPLWPEVLDLSKRASRRLYELAGKAYVGWDIAVTDDKAVIIEGNNKPAPEVAQRPLWLYRKEGLSHIAERYLK